MCASRAPHSEPGRALREGVAASDRRVALGRSITCIASRRFHLDRRTEALRAIERGTNGIVLSFMLFNILPTLPRSGSGKSCGAVFGELRDRDAGHTRRLRGSR
jgi:hypothetical protein